MNLSLFLAGKRPNKRSVQKAADHLIAIYGSTTTLEVKKYLRAKGYIAFQRDVSSKMELLSDELGWAFMCNGQYRAYFVPVATTTPSPGKYQLLHSAN